ncbi:porin [Paraburkholderia dilworthii]|uniref:porin n=1 Tax=Paraburkholderia dilworthii TaxID=948106 RepID=UPI0004892CE7|nr:porin [Paraburkholderia dilworthii]
MKKTLILMIVPVALATTAQAQSSVTLYGLIDAGFSYTNNAGGSHQYQMAAGNLQGDRWGLRGNEDLGGGLKAVFVLESGFNVFNGKLAQGGAGFGRQAFVGLSSNQYGTVTIGRQYDSFQDYVWMYEAANQFAPYYAAHPGDLDNLNGGNRINNAIKFNSVSYGGFTFGGLYSLGGIAGDFNRNQLWSVGANYTQGPLSAGVAFERAQDPNYSLYGTTPSASTTASNMTGSRVYSGYASAKRQQTFIAGATYKIGAATVGAVYSNIQFQEIGALPGLPATGAGGDAKFHNAEINFRYQVSPAFLAGIAYNYTKGYGVNDAHYHQAVVGVDYLLSKRTDVYADVIGQHASGTDSTGRPAVANLAFTTASTTANQVVAVVGIRHKF